MARFSSVFAPVIALSLFAGFVDAQAFLTSSGFFAAFMSGNTTRLAVGSAGRAWLDVELGLSLVLSFVAGAMLAAIVSRAAPNRREAAGMALVGALMVVAAVLAAEWANRYVPLALAGGMGAMHATTAGESGAPHPGYPTEALVRLGRGVADMLLGVAQHTDWVRHMLVWAGFAVGAVLGAAAYHRNTVTGLWFAALVAAALAIWAAVRRRGAGAPWH